MFLGSNTEFIVECVVPNLLHIIPVSDDTVLNRVLERQDTTFGLGFITDVGILLAHADLSKQKQGRSFLFNNALGGPISNS